MAELFVNNGDPDQIPHSTASDLGLHSLPIALLGISRLKLVKQIRHLHNKKVNHSTKQIVKLAKKRLTPNNPLNTVDPCVPLFSLYMIGERRLVYGMFDNDLNHNMRRIII